jgi:hypothetical protein
MLPRKSLDSLPRNKLIKPGVTLLEFDSVSLNPGPNLERKEEMTIEEIAYLSLRTVMIASVTLVLMSAACGDDDCPTCPLVTCENENFDGMLCVSMTPGTHAIFAIDTQTDSVLDSFLLGDEYLSIDVSSDGKPIAVCIPLVTFVVDAETYEIVRVIEPLADARFFDENRFILGELGGGYSLYCVDD